MLFLFLLFGGGLAWNNAGHFIIAAIARQSGLDPELAHRIDHYTRLNQGDWKDSATGNFVFTAAWPDLMSFKYNMTLWSTMHYIEEPYVVNFSKPVPPAALVNVAWALDYLWYSLRSKDTTPALTALSTRLALHFVGDVHQPLHALTLYNEDYPDGNFLGVKVKCCKKESNWGDLHDLWDIAGGSFPDIPYPLTFSNMSWVREAARKVMTEYPESSFSSQQLEVNHGIGYVWKNESYDLAVKYGYSNASWALNPAVEYPEPTRFYKTRTQQVTKQRIALAGYRLRKWMEALNSAGAWPAGPILLSHEFGLYLFWSAMCFSLILLAVDTFLFCKRGKKADTQT